ncbi:hypothetical protein Sste5346_007952 [Sporothrix stenoceras]|uniref:Uncharacterized protein n=1 Tax=Sporothrix stenoceras TaxID=5173 RepID=A0ABR3YSX6_9PEZI
MNGKSVGSHWDAVFNALKFAVSAWPIVFAAVVAQCFKTYATYRVERGIKLLQLEQLVGSNSFASAMKQPIMLRRLDIYTLAIFVAWCLSPIGGQALVRVATNEWREDCTNTTIWYLSRNGINPVYDPANDFYEDGNDYGTHLQQATMTFGTIFDPDAGLGGQKTNYYQDSWGNPQTFMPSGNLSSVFGIPYFVTDSLFYAESQPYYYENSPLTKIGYEGSGANMQRQESFNFTLESSYFGFECGDWQTISSAEMADKISEYNLQCTNVDIPTYYMAFGWPDADGVYGENTNSSASILRWGSFNWLTAEANASTIDILDINSTDTAFPPMRNSTATYSYIECPVQQHYVEYGIQCAIVEEDYDNGAAYQCLFDENIFGKNLSADTQPGTPFYQFTDDFVDAVVPTVYTGLTTISPFERFLASNGRKFDTLFEFNDNIAPPGKINSSYAYWYDMANNTEPYHFADTFSYAFNSWMDAGYCPGTCRTAYPTLLLNRAMDLGIPVTTVEDHLTNASAILGDELLIPEEMFKSVEGTWCYTSDYIYVIHAPYLVLLYICSVGLLFLGIASVVIESRVVAPDILGYASTVARNSRYLHLPATAPGMSGADRVRKFGGTVVMMQDVKKDAAVGKIALGNKKHDSAPLRVDRTYR